MGTLRLLLALAVLVQHGGALFGLKMTGGPLAVEAFFIISGFYMTLILEQKYRHVDRPYLLFMGNRLLRLFPAYLAVLALTIASYYVVEWSTGLKLGTRWGGVPAWVEHGASMSLATKAALGFTNLSLVGLDWTLFVRYLPADGSLEFVRNSFRAAEPGYQFAIVPQAWTLSLELAFYALAPFLVRRRWWVVAAFGVGSLLLRWFDAKYLGLNFDPWTYRFFPHELVLFLAGCLACKAYRSLFEQKPPPALRWLGPGVLIITLASTIWYTQLPGSGAAKHVGYLLLITLGLPVLFAYTRGWRWERAIGELSYPLYICHVLLLPYAEYFAKEHAQFSRIGLLVPASLITAALIHWLIERPVDRLRQRRVISHTLPHGSDRPNA